MTHHLRAYFQHSFLLLVLALLAPGLPVQVMAQISQGKMPQQWNTSEPVSIEWMEFEALDMEQIAREDAAT
ncbi:MAG: hypothetical protein VXY58_06485, partial [Bacteroidota bacterium]|nr:hypothetical protein [Bacteroidota bacterium]